MHGHDLIVIGASAGGVEALCLLVKALPADLPAAVCVVLHVPAHGTSLLPTILSRSGSLPARHPQDGEPIAPGTVYVAPPDHHLLVHEGHFQLVRGPRENGHRPAVDPLFRTAARWYGGRVVGVVLTGALDDGSAGLAAIKTRGGLAVVQDPAEALYPGMPRHAVEAVRADYVLPLAEIAPTLCRLAREPAGPSRGDAASVGDIERESAIDEFDLDTIAASDHPGVPSGWACPDCGGALWEVHERDLIRFRCRVGHAWSINSLLAEQSHAVEVALWSALRALEERAVLSGRLADRLDARGNARSAGRFRDQSGESRSRAALIRKVLLDGEPDAEHRADAPSPSKPAGHRTEGGDRTPHGLTRRPVPARGSAWRHWPPPSAASTPWGASSKGSRPTSRPPWSSCSTWSPTGSANWRGSCRGAPPCRWSRPRRAPPWPPGSSSWRRRTTMWSSTRT